MYCVIHHYPIWEFTRGILCKENQRLACAVFLYGGATILLVACCLAGEMIDSPLFEGASIIPPNTVVYGRDTPQGKSALGVRSFPMWGGAIFARFLLVGRNN